MTRTAPDLPERTFAFSCEIVQLYRVLIAIPGFPLGIARQILHSGTSIGANVEEGRAASSRRDLTARLVIALKEARETKYWLRLIQATTLASEATTAGVSQEIDELVAILTVSVRRLRAG